MCERQNVAIDRASLRDELFCARSNVIQVFPARTAVLERIPSRVLFANLYRAQTFELPVVPLDQILIALERT
jgi:hypothetical protein